MNDVEPTPIHDQLWVETYAPEYVPQRPATSDGMPDWLAVLVAVAILVIAFFSMVA